MLSQLFIQNIAVIEKVQVAFEKGLNVFTGETGAGKSIVIDAINAVLGNRTSRDLVRTGAPKALVTALFEGCLLYTSRNCEKLYRKSAVPIEQIRCSRWIFGEFNERFA